MSLINCKVELKLKWTKYYLLFATSNNNLYNNDNDNVVNNIIFSIKNTKLFVPVATWPASDNQKL